MICNPLVKCQVSTRRCEQRLALAYCRGRADAAVERKGLSELSFGLRGPPRLAKRPSGLQSRPRLERPRPQSSELLRRVREIVGEDRGPCPLPGRRRAGARADEIQVA